MEYIACIVAQKIMQKYVFFSWNIFGIKSDNISYTCTYTYIKIHHIYKCHKVNVHVVKINSDFYL